MYQFAIMVDEEIYLKPASPSPVEIDDSAVLGYTTYTDTFPDKDGEANFVEEGAPYAKVEGGIKKPMLF